MSNHHTSKIVWGGPGKTAKTLDGFFAELGAERASKLQAVSLDLGPAFHKSVTKNAPDATICADPYHLVALANRPWTRCVATSSSSYAAYPTRACR